MSDVMTILKYNKNFYISYIYNRYRKFIW